MSLLNACSSPQPVVCGCPLSYSARVIETVSAPPAAGLMVKVAERDVPLSEAVITALVVACTCVVLMLKLLDCEPAGTVTLAGTMAAALFLVIVTVVAAWRDCG